MADHNRPYAPTVRPELRKPLTVDEDSDEVRIFYQICVFGDAHANTGHLTA